MLVIGGLLGGLLLFGLLGPAFARKPGILIPVDNAAYGSSVGKAATGGGGTCDDIPGSDKLSCAVELDPGSGPSGSMIVTRRSRGCWKAEWERGKGKPITGCVNLRDVLVPKAPGAGLY